MKQLFVMCALGLGLAVAACGDDGDGGNGNGGGDPRIDAILALTGDADNGEVIYMQPTTGQCSLITCHGSDGEGEFSTSPALSVVVPVRTDRSLVDTIINGFGTMAAIQTVDDQQVADVLAYSRREWGGPP